MRDRLLDGADLVGPAGRGASPDDDAAAIAGRHRMTCHLGRREVHPRGDQALRGCEHGRVAPGALGDEPLLDERLVHEGVPEREAIPRRIGRVLDDQTRRDALGERGQRLVIADVRGRRHQAHVELLADDGRPADDVTLGGSKPAATGANGLGEGPGDRDGRVALTGTRGRIDPAGLDDRSGKLFERERVPPGQADQLGRHLGRGSPAEQFLEHVGRLVGRERPQRELADPDAAEFGTQSLQRDRDRVVVRTERDEKGDAARQRSREQRGQRQTARIRPVEVFEHHEQAAGSCERAEVADRRLIQRARIAADIDRTRAKLRQEHRREAERDGVLAGRSETIARRAPDRIANDSERLGQPKVGPPLHDGPSPLPRGSDRPTGEPRLADAGLADEGDGGERFLVGQEAPQRVELRGSSEDRAGKQGRTIRPRHGLSMTDPVAERSP